MATSWTIVERAGGRLLKEDGDNVLLETGFDIIIDYITDFTNRSEPSVSWSDRTPQSSTWDIIDSRIGMSWSQLDDPWSEEIRTWSEFVITAWTENVTSSESWTIRSNP